EKKQVHAAKPARRADTAPKKREPDAVRSVPKPAPKRKAIPATAVEQAPARPLKPRTGERPAEQVPVILESSGAGDFHL
ncbi:hypothetical protein SB759_39765, partial [Pseudomonas sp. SIMBA_059]